MADDPNALAHSASGPATISTPIGDVLTRIGAAEYLRKTYGVGSPGFLARIASSGAGPRFFRISGRREVLYRMADLDIWARSQFDRALQSTVAA